MKPENCAITFDTTDLAQTACTSNAISLENMFLFAVQIVLTGSPVGTLKLQASCDKGNPDATTYAGKTAGVTHWTDIANSSVSITTAGSTVYNITDCGYNWFRVVYTKGSGTGAISSARANLKGV